MLYVLAFAFCSIETSPEKVYTAKVKCKVGVCDMVAGLFVGNATRPAFSPIF